MSHDVIIVTPRPVGNQVKWELCQGTDCGGPGASPPSKYPDIVIPEKSPNHGVVFAINDPHNTGITFARSQSNPTDASLAFAVDVGKGKHPTSGINSANQFDQIKLATPTALTLRDKNDNQGDLWLSYTLHFVGRDNQPVASLDPDWKNGGGGTTIDSGATAYAIAGAVGGALLALLFVRLALGWRARA